MLSGSAVRQFMYLWLESMGIDPTTLVTAIRDRGDRYRAIKELEEAGLVDVERLPGKASKVVIHSISSKYISINICGTQEVATCSQNPLQGCSQNPPHVGEITYREDPPLVGENDYTYDTPLEEAVDLDTMSLEGRDTPALRNTPFRKRREKQRAFIKRAWGEFYPNLPPLIDANAVEFLRQLDESAEEVYLLFQEFQGNPKVGINYLKAVIRNRKQKLAESEATQSEATTSPASGSKNFPGWDSDEDYYAHQRKVEEIQQWMSENGISDDD